MPHSIGRTMTRLRGVIMPHLTGVLLSPHCSMQLLRKMVRLLVTTIMEVPITGKCPKTGSVLQAQGIPYYSKIHKNATIKGLLGWLTDFVVTFGYTTTQSCSSCCNVAS